MKLLNGSKLDSAIKSSSKIHWDKGYVDIYKQDITLDGNSFKKRDKIYYKNNWVDTKPICINNIDKYLIRWRQPDLSLILYKLSTSPIINKPSRILNLLWSIYIFSILTISGVVYLLLSSIYTVLLALSIV